MKSLLWFLKKDKAVPPKQPPAPIQTLIRLLQYDGEWTVTEFRLAHVSGLSMWIANGKRNLNVRDPFYLEFTPEEQEWLWPHVQRILDLKRKAALQQLKTMLDDA